MSAILHWFAAPEWLQVIKTLLHSMWQGLLIAGLLALLMRRVVNPHWRYRFALVALMMIPTVGIVTWAGLNSPNRPLPAAVVQPKQIETTPTVAFNHNPPTRVVALANYPPATRVSSWTAWLALLWFFGTGAMLARAGIKLAGAERLRRSCQPLNNPQVTQLFNEARRAIGVARNIRLGITDKLTSPVVAGVIVPTLILPLALVGTLTPDQIRFILLHELAHIRRGDYFANLLQLFVEAVLFFNPAIWWITHQVRREREACCDALAIELCGTPADYARTLLQVAENVLAAAPAAAPAFGDKREPSSLADRVQRLLVPGYRPSLRLTWRAMLTALLLGATLLVLSAKGARVAVAQISKSSEQTTNEKEAKVQKRESNARIQSQSFRNSSRLASTDLLFGPDVPAQLESRRWIWRHANDNPFTDVTFNLPPYNPSPHQVRSGNPIALASGNAKAMIESADQSGINIWNVEGKNQPQQQWFWYPTIKNPPSTKARVEAVQRRLDATRPQILAKAHPEAIRPAQRNRNVSVVGSMSSTTNVPELAISSLNDDGRVEFNANSGITVITNGGLVRYKDTVVRADVIELNHKTGEMKATGNYRIETPNGVTESTSGALNIFSNAPQSNLPETRTATAESSPSVLLIRTFNVDPNTFWKALESTIAVPPVRTNVNRIVRDFFATLGVDLNPPKSLLFNDRAGELLVRSTRKDLDIIQAALVVLNKEAPQVNIKARFVEIDATAKNSAYELLLGIIPTNTSTTSKQSGSSSEKKGSSNSSTTNPALEFTGILTEPQYRMVLRALEERKGVDVLAMQEVTTLSGRQAQMQTAEMRTVVNGLGLPVQPLPGNTSTNISTNSFYQTQLIPFGPVLDVVPTVSLDGQTIDMTVAPTLTEFLGYDDPDRIRSLPKASGNDDVLLPLPRMRVRQMTANVKVWDGQTLVLGMANDQLISKQSNGGFLKLEYAAAKKKQLLVFITPTIIDQTGNRAHAELESIPGRPQTPRN